MKIYRFDTQTGVYLGEDFTDDPGMGTPILPSDSTTIAPPQVKPGDTLYFNEREQRWEVRNRPTPLSLIRSAGKIGTLASETETKS
ncbi:hypothetical protein KI811_00955 [Geobacter hydrogenophilus]|uniref:Uncharacterized protein n=1 Tax=Geobacter hydrogenophilus TaxID=40983 RepID=A0A9W6LEQ6_9BACT|nr:hypothetical protein [Geobacter hydrogenophilus]MBT0892386.1 hypothetical protein [Geobacter hydrogenophilus]GLI39781.1 hypothetical protein GHYDROH2_32820 [Geobacter hydrogenophilus]